MGVCESSTEIQEKYNRIDYEPLKFPPLQMKVAVEVEDGMQVFQLLNSSKLFDLLPSNCRSQVAGSPVYEPSRCVSPLMCAALWPDKLMLFSNNWILRSFCQFSQECRREVLKRRQQHIQYHSLKQYPSALYVYCLIINTERCSKH